MHIKEDSVRLKLFMDVLEGTKATVSYSFLFLSLIQTPLVMFASHVHALAHSVSVYTSKQ